MATDHVHQRARLAAYIVPIEHCNHHQRSLLFFCGGLGSDHSVLDIQHPSLRSSLQGGVYSIGLPNCPRHFESGFPYTVSALVFRLTCSIGFWRLSFSYALLGDNSPGVIQ